MKIHIPKNSTQRSRIFWISLVSIGLMLGLSFTSYSSLFSEETEKQTQTALIQDALLNSISTSDKSQNENDTPISLEALAPEKQLQSTKSPAPIAVYLSWLKNPETSMIVYWVTERSSKEKESGEKQDVLAPDPSYKILLQKVIESPSIESPHVEVSKDASETQKEPLITKAEESKTEAIWTSHVAITTPFPENNPYLLHAVSLEGLTENSLYLFHIEGTEIRHTFRTAPKALDVPITFVIGGDTYKQDELFREMNITAAKISPLFAVLGGDLAYATPTNKKSPENCTKWILWLKAWYETMQTKDFKPEQKELPSRLIPMIAAIGNHEVKGRYRQTKHEALFFYALFRDPFLSKSYYTLRFSDYLSLYILDSGHTASISGDQKEWLTDEMKNDLLIYHKIACYHVPAYPSVRYYRNEMSSQIRRHWIPIFDKYRLHLAFENHDHAYKRTFPLKNSSIHPRGVVYIGDGSWGVPERVPKKASKTSYLIKTAQERQACVVTLSMKSRKVVVLNSVGKEIDHYEETVDQVLNTSTKKK